MTRPHTLLVFALFRAFKPATHFRPESSLLIIVTENVSNSVMEKVSFLAFVFCAAGSMWFLQSDMATELRSDISEQRRVAHKASKDASSSELYRTTKKKLSEQWK